MRVGPEKVYSKEAGWQMKARADTARWGQEASKGRAALLRKLPEAARWGCIHALVAGTGSGQSKKLASPDPKRTPGLEVGCGTCAALHSSFDDRKQGPQVRPLL